MIDLPDELQPRRPVIFVSRVKCPSCHGTDHATTRSADQGDGSRLQSKTCRSCGVRFYVVIE